MAVEFWNHFPLPSIAVPPPGIMEAHQAKLAFFKASMCQQLLEKLVVHYLLLTDEELQCWENSPEEFGEFLTDKLATQYCGSCVCH